MSSGPTGLGPNAMVARFSLLDHAAFITPGIDTPFMEVLDRDGTTMTSETAGFRFVASTNVLYLRNPIGDWTRLITTDQVTEGLGVSGFSSGLVLYFSISGANNSLTMSLDTSGEQTLVTTGNGSSSIIIGQFISGINIPGVTMIPAGAWQIGFFAKQSVPSNTVAGIYFELWTATQDGIISTQISSNYDNPTIISSTSNYTFYNTILNVSTTLITASTRIIIKIYGYKLVNGETMTVAFGGQTPTQIVTSLFATSSNLVPDPLAVTTLYTNTIENNTSDTLNITAPNVFINGASIGSYTSYMFTRYGDAIFGGHPWAAAASSADGSKLAIVGGKQNYWYINDGVYTSTDGGNTWSTPNLYGVFTAVGYSGDGSILMAGTYDVYLSRDNGVTWTAPNGILSQDWRAFAMSYNGQYILAVGDNAPNRGTYMFISTDYGANFTQGPDGTQTYAVMSADGSKMISYGNTGWYGHLYLSTDYGSNFSSITPTVNSGASWQRGMGPIACSSDASRIYIMNADNLFVSTDLLSSVTQLTGFPSDWGFTALTCSSDGTKLFATKNHDNYTTYVYLSTDSGVTWTQQTSAGKRELAGSSV